MAFKFVLIAALVAAAQAGVIPTYYAAPSYKYISPYPAAYQPAPVAAPIAYAAPKALDVEEYDPHPAYSFAYEVQDPLTGDSKSHNEVRNGDVVQGQYSLIDPDGTKRTVDYTADAHNGFNAVVRKEPIVHVAPVLPAAKLIAAPYHAPAHHAYAAPAHQAYAAPVHQAYAAPVHHAYAAPANLAYAAPTPLHYAPKVYGYPTAR